VDEDEMALTVWWTEHVDGFDLELYYTRFIKKAGEWVEPETIKVMP
jgi:hypothetical protein